MHTITSPGLLDLSGIRYIVLRCPEIETHMYGGTGGFVDIAQGICTFKLASSNNNEITYIRFDYTRFSRRSCHPIGKLSRLTFRFEQTNGKLYDFKGVNHQMLIVVKYYVFHTKDRRVTSTINPNYDPNIMKYMFGSNNNVPNHEAMRYMVDRVRPIEDQLGRLMESSDDDDDDSDY
jgi:hypothetical protein